MLIMPKFVEKNRLNMPSTRIRQEQEIVAQMVRIYCRQNDIISSDSCYPASATRIFS